MRGGRLELRGRESIRVDDVIRVVSNGIEGRENLCDKQKVGKVKNSA